jgi:hypothetical protein
MIFGTHVTLLLIGLACVDSTLAQRDHLAENYAESRIRAGEGRNRGSEFRLVLWEMSDSARPAETMTSRIIWETDRGNPNAVIYATVIGDWAPSSPIAIIVNGGTQGRPGNRFERRFSFAAPRAPGTYRVRWILTQAFAPLTEFYGQARGDVNNPPGGTWAEARFTVVAAGDARSPTVARGRDWYLDRIREGVHDAHRLGQFQRAFRTAIEIRDIVSDTKRELTYRTLRSIGAVRVNTPDGPRALEQLARDRIVAQVPGLAGSDLVEDPATVVAALLISDRDYFLHSMKIVQIDGQYISVADALARGSGLDPAVSRELMAVVAAADTLSRGDDVLTSLDVLQCGLDRLPPLIQQWQERRAARGHDRDWGRDDSPGSDRQRDDDARARQERERRAAEEQRQEAERRAEQEQRARAAEERRQAEEERAREAQARATAEKAARHPLGLAVETLTNENRQELGLYLGTRGVVVLHIQPGSAAERAGLRVGMVIESVQHRTVGGEAEFERHTGSTRPGDSLVLGIWRKAGSRWERANRVIQVGN